jgi:biotin carboxylase
MSAGPRLLVTVDEAYGSLAAVRALAAAGYEPVIGVWQPDTYAARSRAHAGVVELPSPETDAAAYARAVASAAERLGVRAVLPGTEGTLIALARHRKLLPADVAVGTCEPDVVKLATDKDAVGRLAEQAGLRTPPTELLSGAEAAERAHDLAYPLVLKAARSVTETDGRFEHVDTRRIDTPDGLRAAVAGLPDEQCLVQPYLDGSLYSIGAIAWEGNVLGACHQLTRRIWPPHVGGSSYAETVPPDRALESRVAELVRAIGWSGIVHVQFIRSREAAYLIDFNPRVYGSIALAIRAGVNLPAAWADLLLGRSPRIGTCRAGVRYRALEDDVRALARELAAGNRRAAITGFVPQRDTVDAVLSLRDPGPFVLSLGKLAAKARARVSGARG